MHMNKGAGADKAEIEAEDNPETEESLEILDYWRDQVVQQLGRADAVFDLNKGRGAAWNRGEKIFKNKIWKVIAFSIVILTSITTSKLKGSLNTQYM